jgi:anti-sigma-K factor RskA
MKQTDLNEDLLARYLLGELTEEEQVRVEERAFNDPETLAQILAMENDLVDEYVRGELPGEARRRFELKFLNSAERRRKIEFAGTLARLDPTSLNVTADASAAANAAPAFSTPDATQNSSAQSSRWRSFLDSLARFPLTPRLSFAALTLVLLIGGTLFFINRQRREDKFIVRQTEQTSPRPASSPDTSNNATPLTQTAQPPIAAAPTPASTESAQNHRPDRGASENRSPAERGGTQASPPVKVNHPAPSGLSVATLVFSSGMTRGDNDPAKKFLLQPAATAARLSFALEKGDEYRSYQVEVRAADGSPVFQSAQLTAHATRSGQSLTVSLPARKLPAGSYEALLRGVADGGRSQLLGDYYFKVVNR